MNIVSWRDVVRDRPSAVALGNFDGVHLGHRRILEAMRERADAAGVEPLALTFEPHPRQFLFPDAKTSLLTSPREKAARIAELGITVVTLSFDADLAALAAEEFAAEVLMRRLRGAFFFLGADHRFGRGARGDAALLRSLARSPGAGPDNRVFEVPPVFEQGEPVSSSAIRHHLKDGNIARAGAMLGRPYALRGAVVPGSGRGRPLGFPTANLRVEDPRKILPFGVFGGAVRLDGALRPAVANIGLRPTFNENGAGEGGLTPSVEVHLPDWSGNLYGQTLEFEIRRHLRPERRFDSIEALRLQIGRDVAEWRRFCPDPDSDPER